VVQSSGSLAGLSCGLTLPLIITSRSIVTLPYPGFSGSNAPEG
jgi:hypothetical protein